MLPEIIELPGGGVDIVYKITIDEELIKSQAAEMALQVKEHTFEHMKLIIEEAINSPLSKSQKGLVIQMFMDEFIEQIAKQTGELLIECNDYLTGRMKEVIGELDFSKE